MGILFTGYKKGLKTVTHVPKVGRPCLLTQELFDKIIEAVPRGLRPNTIAGLCGVAPKNLEYWLKTGMKDMEEGNSTIFSQLCAKFHNARTLKIAQWIEHIENRVQNWTALWELLKVCAREDFGVEAVEYKELLEMYSGLSESFKKFTQQPIQGVNQDG